MHPRAIEILKDPTHRHVFGPKRYFLEYGGRGSGKSFVLTEGLILLADMGKHKILCAREIMNSISDSVHAQLVSHIERLGLQQRFIVTKNSIKNRATGSEFLYRGLRTNVSAVKSLADIDICFVEEAQSVSAASWKVLLPTIRNPGSRFIMACNPENIDDFLSQRWIVKPCVDTIAKRVNWNSNPYFPQELENERQYALNLIKTAPNEDARVQAQADYDWVWEGDFRRVTAAQILRRVEVKEFVAPYGVEFKFGMDFGFAQDPNALIRMFEIDNDLYIDYEAVGRCELDELPTLMNSVPGVGQWPIYADAARPETISHLRAKEYNITAASKWQGSVEDGIAHLNQYHRIYVHPRCTNVIAESKLYKYKVDRVSEAVLPIPVDKDNHCIAEGVLVSTGRGQVPIEHVVPGDLVMTRDGYREVYGAVCTDVDREVIEIETEAGYALRCTPCHQVWTENRGFVRADELRYDDYLVHYDPTDHELRKEGIPHSRWGALLALSRRARKKLSELFLLPGMGRL